MVRSAAWSRPCVDDQVKWMQQLAGKAHLVELDKDPHDRSQSGTSKCGIWTWDWWHVREEDDGIWGTCKRCKRWEEKHGPASSL